MNDYEAKLEARRKRLERRADKAASEAGTRYKTARTMAEAIPFGQPILVGHHSEKRDRAYRGKIESSFRKAFEANDRAGKLRTRAAQVGTGGISSDDPDAITKLKQEAEKLEALQDRMKAANRLVRKGDRAGLVALGFSDAHVTQLLTPDFCNRLGFPSYALSNNNANIRRIRARISDLVQRRQSELVEIDDADFTYREDPDENRVMFEFPGKPDAETRSLLKAHAFKWSPTRGAWVRKLSGSGRMAGQIVRNALLAKAVQKGKDA